MLDAFTQHLHSDAFAQRARHPEHPKAFTRSRCLPLPALVCALMSLGSGSQQAQLDAFFANLLGQTGLVRGISDRGFAKARSQLHLPGLQWLNAQLLALAGQRNQSLWRGFRLVAGDASQLSAAVRPCHQLRSAASGDQRLFALYLPGSELTLHAQVHSACVGERAMLVEALDALDPAQDVLLLDRGYPAAWLVALLKQRGIRFVIRCDSGSGFAAVRRFARSGQAEQTLTLPAPTRAEQQNWGLAQPTAPEVRLVGVVNPKGQCQVLMTNLSPAEVPAGAFAALYHQRWRIEEAFKRLKHRSHLEAVSGLSQQALLIDVAAKVLADNVVSLLCQQLQPESHNHAIVEDRVCGPAAPERRLNRSYAAHACRRTLGAIFLGVGDVVAQIANLLQQLRANTQRHLPGRSQPRHMGKTKPHPKLAYKG